MIDFSQREGSAMSELTGRYTIAILLAWPGTVLCGSTVCSLVKDRGLTTKLLVCKIEKNALPGPER